MEEAFLQHIWQFKKFEVQNLQSTRNEPIVLIRTGVLNRGEGPDFYNAEMYINHLHWAGTVEVHTKSSEWYVHRHETNPKYNNVILHVVWEHDVDVYNSDNNPITTVELKHYVSKELYSKYKQFFTTKTWINCENELPYVDTFTLENWKERLFLERLEEKAEYYENIWNNTHKNWEHTLFIGLAKAFGLNINGNAFAENVAQIPIQVLYKERHNLMTLEALLLGANGLLTNEYQDSYPIQLQLQWEYLKYKYNFTVCTLPVTFFKLRPDNFPTIRLVQLAELYHKTEQLCAEILKTDYNSLYRLFKNVNVSEYWETHYNWEKNSPKKTKQLSDSFIHLILLNCVIPLKYLYNNQLNNLDIEAILTLTQQIPSEENAVIDKFRSFKMEIKNAYESQAYLHLKKHYCNTLNCMNCQIGKMILFTNM